jgi:ankyrin repeat protein
MVNFMWRRLAYIGLSLFAIFGGMVWCTLWAGKPTGERFCVKGQHKYCVVHHMRLQKGTATVLYGLPYISKEYQQAVKGFPNANTRVSGGCLVGRDSPRTREVLYCPLCREAEATWTAAQRATDKAELLEAIAECPAEELGGEKGLGFLYHAVRYGYVDVARILIDKGAEVGARDEYAGTALHCAAEQEQADVVKLLIGAGADVNARDSLGRTALHYAAWFSSKEVVSTLVQNGANMNAEDDDEDTPLSFASLFNHRHPEVAVYLEELGAINNPSFIRRVDKCTDVNAKNEEGETLLHEAASEGYYNAAKRLIQKGSNVNARDADGGTPLHASIWRCNPHLIKLLIESRADVDAKDDGGETALHMAARQSRRSAVKVLIEGGADVNARDESGRTPLHTSVISRNVRVVRLLIDAGADIDARNEFGESPLDIALNWSSAEIIAVLREYVDVERANR